MVPKHQVGLHCVDWGVLRVSPSHCMHPFARLPWHRPASSHGSQAPDWLASCWLGDFRGLTFTLLASNRTVALASSTILPWFPSTKFSCIVLIGRSQGSHLYIACIQSDGCRGIVQHLSQVRKHQFGWHYLDWGFFRVYPSHSLHPVARLPWYRLASFHGYEGWPISC